MSDPQQPGQPQYASQQGPPPPYPPQGWGPPPPAAPTKKKRRTWLWVTLGIVALLVIIGIANGGGSTTPTQSPSGAVGGTAPEASSDTATVRYEVIGGSRASNVTFNSDGGGSISQESNVKLPWSKDIQVERGFAITSLTAQNAGSGQITCRIIVDGQVVKENTSSGQYSVVTCTGDPIS